MHLFALTTAIPPQMKQYALVFNQLTEKCFRHCISQLNIRTLSDTEVREIT